MSDDFVYAAQLDDNGNVTVERQQLTKAERAEVQELDWAEADYLRTTDTYSPEGFLNWLQGQGLDDLARRWEEQLASSRDPAPGETTGDLGRLGQALSSSTSAATCNTQKTSFPSTYLAEIFTGFNYAGTKGCLYGSVTGHVNVATLLAGTFAGDIDSIKTFSRTLCSVNSVNVHGPALTAYCPSPQAPIAYDIDPTLCIGGVH
jgi:hypothetical protein